MAVYVSLEMTPVRLILLVLSLLMSVAIAAEPALPENFELTFVVMSDDTRLGETRWTLSKDQHNYYRFETVTRATGLVSLVMGGERRERSTWQYYEQGLRPLSYRYQRSGAGGRQVDIEFDWEHGVARNTAQGTTWKMKLEPGTLDKLLYMLALMQDLRSGKEQFSYRIADGGRLKTYGAEVLGREVLSTRLGALETIKVKPQSTPTGRETILWYAPNLHYLPVQVQHRDKNDVLVMRIESLEGLALQASQPPS